MNITKAIRVPLALPALVMTAALAAFLTACGTPTPQGVTAVQIVGGERNLEVGNDTLLTAVVTASSGTSTAVSWSSDAPDVATVAADGRVTAIGVGSANVSAVSAADTSKTAAVTITVAFEPGTEGVVGATYMPMSTTPPATSASFFMLEPSPVISSAAVTEFAPGAYIGPAGLIAEDGSVTIKLPAGADLPMAVIGTAENFLTQLTGTDCSLEASDLTVPVTYAKIELTTTPGVLVMTTEGPYFSLVTDVVIDIEPPDPAEVYAAGFVTWVFAKEAVSVKTVGSDCEISSAPFATDLALEQGWNQLTWNIEYDSGTSTVTSLTLQESSVEEVFISPISLFGAT